MARASPTNLGLSYAALALRYKADPAGYRGFMVLELNIPYSTRRAWRTDHKPHGSQTTDHILRFSCMRETRKYDRTPYRACKKVHADSSHEARILLGRASEKPVAKVIIK